LTKQDVQSSTAKTNNKEMNIKKMDNKEMDDKEMNIKENQKRERNERAARRSILKEDKEEDASSAPASKKPRLDQLLSWSTSILDILTASGRKSLPTFFSEDQETESGPGVLDIFDAKEDEEKVSKKPRLDLLDMQLSSSNTTSVLDILTASGMKPLPTFSDEDQVIKDTESRPGVLDIFDALAEDMEPAVEVVMEEDTVQEEVILDPYWFSGPPAMEENFSGPPATEENSMEKALLEEEDYCRKEEGFLGSEAGAQAKDNTHKTRSSRKVYLSPALVWLEKEGLPAAKREAKALGVEVDEEGLMERALLKWKMMASEEKVVWRKRVEVESANKKI